MFFGIFGVSGANAKSKIRIFLLHSPWADEFHFSLLMEELRVVTIEKNVSEDLCETLGNIFINYSRSRIGNKKNLGTKGLVLGLQ